MIEKQYDTSKFQFWLASSRKLNNNAYNAACMSRRQDQNVTNFVKNVNILEFGYYIWNPYEKCTQKSPNMPGIG